MASFTFYDTLVYRLPGSDQQAALAAFDVADWPCQ